jgi:hypothetical protein
VTRQAAIDRLNRLASLLDRARDTARTDARELNALLDEATSTLEAAALTLTEHSIGGVPDPVLAAAARRARASHTALHRVLRDELSLIGRQIAQANVGAEATARYVPPPPSGRHFDRLG